MFFFRSYNCKVQNDSAYGKKADERDNGIAHAAGDLFDITEREHAYYNSDFLRYVVKTKK